MRPRKEIERDFNNAMPEKKYESPASQREKLLFEALLDIRDVLEDFRGLIKRIKAAGFELGFEVVDKHEKIKQKK